MENTFDYYTFIWGVAWHWFDWLLKEKYFEYSKKLGALTHLNILLLKASIIDHKEVRSKNEAMDINFQKQTKFLKCLFSFIWME